MTPSQSSLPPAQLNSEKPGWIDALILAGVLCVMLVGINTTDFTSRTRLILPAWAVKWSPGTIG